MYNSEKVNGMKNRLETNRIDQITVWLGTKINKKHNDDKHGFII